MVSSCHPVTIMFLQISEIHHSKQFNEKITHLDFVNSYARWLEVRIMILNMISQAGTNDIIS